MASTSWITRAMALPMRRSWRGVAAHQRLGDQEAEKDAHHQAGQSPQDGSHEAAAAPQQRHDHRARTDGQRQRQGFRGDGKHEDPGQQPAVDAER